MSFGFSLSNALSGLSAASRSIEVISANIANATTPEYGRREVVLSSASLGGQSGGVRVDAVRRVVDRAAIADRRLADASLGGAAVRGDFLARIEKAVGHPGAAGSLGDRITALEAALVDAGSRPDQIDRLTSLRDSALALTGQFNRLSNEIRTLRTDADTEISRQVADLNTSLSRIADLNGRIRGRQGGGREANALIDERQRLIDTVSSLVPMREIERSGGTVALYTPSGAALVDGPAAKIGFTPTGFIDPAMTLASGALSGLTLNGHPIAVSGENAPLAGGALAAGFELRDNLAVTANARLDALARDLYERFADPALDPTLPAGSAGLFTDGGQAFNPANEIGLAGRLAVNAQTDPAQGGALYRLRDGLGATLPGPAGDATLLNRYADALASRRTPLTGGFSSTGGSTAELATEYLSSFSTAGLNAEAERSFAAARQQAFRSEEARSGVDTDAEMQKLLMIEKAYAANARILQAVDDMLTTLLGI